MIGWMLSWTGWRPSENIAHQTRASCFHIMILAPTSFLCFVRRSLLPTMTPLAQRKTMSLSAVSRYVWCMQWTWALGWGETHHSRFAIDPSLTRICQSSWKQVESRATLSTSPQYRGRATAHGPNGRMDLRSRNSPLRMQGTSWKRAKTGMWRKKS